MKSKRYRKALNTLEQKKFYDFSEAIELLKRNNFEKSKNLEMSLSLNWSSKQNNIRDFVSIPHPIKKDRIAIIDENVPSSLKEDKNIVFISLESLPKVISNKKKSKWGFNKMFAHSSVLSKIKPFSKILSLKKSFPNIKEGTLSEDLEKSVNDFKNGKIELRNDKGGNFHILIGKTTFDNEQIESNYRTLLKKIISLKPTNLKGDYIKSITLSTTMGPGVRIAI